MAPSPPEPAGLRLVPHRALAPAGAAAIRAAGRIMWVFAWAVACGETRRPLVMLEPKTAELISCRHQPGNLPQHDQATKEITMTRGSHQQITNARTASPHQRRQP
jgi:Spy/CpxP family protein refolding chaperone